MSMKDPKVREGIGRSMIWNIERNRRCALIQADINPGIEPDAEGFFAVSFHNTANGAYAIQNRVRRDFPSLTTRVRNVDGHEWLAEIQVKSK